MAATKILLDTGPLVAYFNRTDQHHDWAVGCWSALFDPLWTCEAVLSETIFILQSEGAGPEPVLRMLERGILRVDFVMNEHRADIVRLLRKYANKRGFRHQQSV